MSSGHADVNRGDAAPWPPIIGNITKENQIRPKTAPGESSTTTTTTKKTIQGPKIAILKFDTVVRRKDGRPRVIKSRWSTNENKKLMTLRGQGLSFLAIAAQIPGRTEEGCKTNFRKLIRRTDPWDKSSDEEDPEVKDEEESDETHSATKRNEAAPVSRPLSIASRPINSAATEPIASRPVNSTAKEPIASKPVNSTAAVPFPNIIPKVKAEVRIPQPVWPLNAPSRPVNSTATQPTASRSIKSIATQPTASRSINSIATGPITSRPVNSTATEQIPVMMPEVKMEVRIPQPIQALGAPSRPAYSTAAVPTPYIIPQAKVEAEVKPLQPVKPAPPPWTGREDSALLEMVQRGFSFAELARRLPERSLGECYMRYRHYYDKWGVKY